MINRVNSLKEIYNTIKSYQLISFDIFNTILMRTVSNPEDIFVLLGEKLIREGILKVDISAEAFGLLRREAEQRVIYKKKELGKTEYHLKEIYMEFPDFFQFDISLLEKLELETELANTYLNPDIYAIIEDLYKDGKIIVLTSDMYLSRKQIENLLLNKGFDLSIVKNIYVSSECGVNKTSGKLFTLVLEEQKVTYADMVHVGDNKQADILGAKKVGIEAVHYALFEQLPLEMVYEKDCFQYGIPELYSMRLIMNQRLKGSKSDFWYREGALVWGPVLAMYIDWVIDMAIRKDIHVIYPLMREGVLIQRLLQVALKYRNITDIEVCKLYVSRDTTVLARYTEFCKDLYDYCVGQPYLTIDGLFCFLGLNIEQSPYAKKGNYTLLALCKEGEKEKLYSYLCNPSVLKLVNKRIARKNSELYAYLNSVMNTTTKYITCDIGFSGTISTAIDTCRRNKGEVITGIHCMLMTQERAIENIFHGSEIYGYLQEFASYQKGLAKYFSFMEGLFMGEEGSTIGYDSKNKKPILAYSEISVKEVEIRKQFQNGVLDFLELYYKINISCLKSRKEAQTLLMRLFQCPTKAEAKQYMGLTFEQNMGMIMTEKVSIEKELQLCRLIHSEDYIRTAKLHNIIWPEAVVAQVEQSFNYHRCLTASGKHDSYVEAMMDICEQLRKEKIKEILVYGAGDVGKVLSSLLQIYEITPFCFIDKNPLLWGQEMMAGVFVCSIEKAASTYSNIPIVIASFAWIEDIKNSIRMAWDEKAVCYYVSEKTIMEG